MDALVRFSDGAPASALLLATILVFSALGLFVRPALIERNLLRPHGLTRRGDYFTLVSSGFIHADLAHLLLNCFTLWAFGFGLERALGTPSFVVLYAFGLLSSSIATWLVHRRNAGYASLGASGAILAVLFASIVVAPTSSIFILPLPVAIPAPLFALAFLAYSVIASRARVGRVNHDAHIAGAIAGVAYMAVTQPGSLQRAFGVWLG
jgi:membrane associated rhomboid family serine protease